MGYANYMLITCKYTHPRRRSQLGSAAGPSRSLRGGDQAEIRGGHASPRPPTSKRDLLPPLPGGSEVVPPTGVCGPPPPGCGSWLVPAACPAVLAPPPRAGRAAGSRARREWSRGSTGPVRAGEPAPQALKASCRRGRHQRRRRPASPGASQAPFRLSGVRIQQSLSVLVLSCPSLRGSPQSNSSPSTAWGVRGRAPPTAWPEIWTQAPPGRPRSPTQRISFLLKWEAEWKRNPGWQGRGRGDKRSCRSVACSTPLPGCGPPTPAGNVGHVWGQRWWRVMCPSSPTSGTASLLPRALPGCRGWRACQPQAHVGSCGSPAQPEPYRCLSWVRGCRPGSCLIPGLMRERVSRVCPSFHHSGACGSSFPVTCCSTERGRERRRPLSQTCA